MYYSEIAISDDGFNAAPFVSEAVAAAQEELFALEETIQSVKSLKPDCDKLDYALAVGSGALCGLFDIFLVGKPGQSPVGDVTDKWFAERTKDFAWVCGWKTPDGDLASAIRYLEKKYKVPYDQRFSGDTGNRINELSLKNHHYKSVGHNPTLLGLFISILDQFKNTSHFVTASESGILSGIRMISIQNADDRFVLQGRNVPEKLFCAFVNWFGHLASDISGSSTSAIEGSCGMGIPSPIWAWVNDIQTIKSALCIDSSEFDTALNKLAIKVYTEGFDFRFQAAQAIPVFLNEIIVRFLYTLRRMLGYFSSLKNEKFSFEKMWKTCEPFSNATVKRMLTVAHGTFCLLDIGDAAISGIAGNGIPFNQVEFFLRLNLIGVGRFSISLYGEAERAFVFRQRADEAAFAEREKQIVEDYIEGLKVLAASYDDLELLGFVDDLKNSDAYMQAFHKSVQLAEKRNVPDEAILKTKADIDSYFRKEQNS